MEGLHETARSIAQRTLAPSRRGSWPRPWSIKIAENQRKCESGGRVVREVRENLFTAFFTFFIPRGGKQLE